jgi:hypothetical protein
MVLILLGKLDIIVFLGGSNVIFDLSAFVLEFADLPLQLCNVLLLIELALLSHKCLLDTVCN